MTSRRRVGKGAKRRAHQSVSGSSDVRLSGLKIEGGAFFYTLAPADRGSDLFVRFGERTRGHGAARGWLSYACFG